MGRQEQPFTHESQHAWDSSRLCFLDSLMLSKGQQTIGAKQSDTTSKHTKAAKRRLVSCAWCVFLTPSSRDNPPGSPRVPGRIQTFHDTAPLLASMLLSKRSAAATTPCFVPPSRETKVPGSALSFSRVYLFAALLGVLLGMSRCWGNAFGFIFGSDV